MRYPRHRESWRSLNSPHHTTQTSNDSLNYKKLIYYFLSILGIQKSSSDCPITQLATVSAVMSSPLLHFIHHVQPISSQSLLRRDRRLHVIPAHVHLVVDSRQG